MFRFNVLEEFKIHIYCLFWSLIHCPKWNIIQNYKNQDTQDTSSELIQCVLANSNEAILVLGDET